MCLGVDFWVFVFVGIVGVEYFGFVVFYVDVFFGNVCVFFVVVVIL